MSRLVLYLILGFMVTGTATAASYDCKATKLSKIENLICDTPSLSILDDNLGFIYHSVIDKNENSYIYFEGYEAVKRDQLTWLKSRNMCSTIKCVEESYIARLKDLISIGNLKISKLSPERLYGLIAKEIGNPNETNFDTNVIFAYYGDNPETYLVQFTMDGSGGGGPCAAASTTYIVYFTVDKDKQAVTQYKYLTASQCNSSYHVFYSWDSDGGVTLGFENNDDQRRYPIFSVELDYPPLTSIRDLGELPDDNNGSISFKSGESNNHSSADSANKEKTPLTGSLVTTSPKKLSIALIDTYGYGDSRQRLLDLGFRNIKIVSPPFLKRSLDPFDILYLPVNWGSYGGKKYLEIENSYKVIHKFIKSGGGIFVEQPNPFRNGENQIITPNILPYKLTFYFKSSPYEFLDVDKTHPITKDIGNYRLPHPGDDLLYIAPEYKILVKGKNPKTSPLLTAVYGQGKILICTHNPSKESNSPTSDEIFIRMINWLADK